MSKWTWTHILDNIFKTEGRRTARTGLVAIALCKTSRRLVFKVGLSGGGAAPADSDPHRYYDDNQ